MTRRRVINPVGHYQPIRSYYSQAVRVDAGSLLFTSAEAPFDIDGNLVGDGDAAVQMRQCIQNLEVTVAAAGASLDDVISMDVLLTDVEDFDRIAWRLASFFRFRECCSRSGLWLLCPDPTIHRNAGGVSARQWVCGHASLRHAGLHACDPRPRQTDSRARWHSGMRTPPGG